jgi:hypothetical protein
MSKKTPIQNKNPQRSASNSKSTSNLTALVTTTSITASLGSLLALRIYEDQKHAHSSSEIATGIAISGLFITAIILLLSMEKDEDD